MPFAISGLLLIYNMDQGDQRYRNVVNQSKYVYHNEIHMWRPSEGGIWPIKAQKSPDERPHPSPKHKDKHKCQGGFHYGAVAATKWTNTSLTSKEMFFLLRYSIQTVVYLGMKLLRGSHESLDAANPFQRTL